MVRSRMCLLCETKWADGPIRNEYRLTSDNWTGGSIYFASRSSELTTCGAPFTVDVDRVYLALAYLLVAKS